jgi:hypothetical protein
MRTSGATPAMIFRPVTKNSSSKMRRSAGSRSASLIELSERSYGMAACLIAKRAGRSAIVVGGTSASAAHGT